MAANCSLVHLLGRRVVLGLVQQRLVQRRVVQQRLVREQWRGRLGGVRGPCRTVICGISA